MFVDLLSIEYRSLANAMQGIIPKVTIAIYMPKKVITLLKMQ